MSYIKLTEVYKDSNSIDCKRVSYYAIGNIILFSHKKEGSTIWLKYPISDCCNFIVKESPEEILKLIKEAE